MRTFGLPIAALLVLAAGGLAVWAFAALAARLRRRKAPQWRHIVVICLSLSLANVVLTALYLTIRSGLHYSGPVQLLTFQYLFSFVIFSAMAAVSSPRASGHWSR